MSGYRTDSSPVKINVVTAEELTSITFQDVKRTGMVFTVVGGLAACTALVVAWFTLSNWRGRRRVLRSLVGNDVDAKLGFAEIDGVWTWSYGMKDSDVDFFKLHRLSLAAADADAADAEAELLERGEDGRGDGKRGGMDAATTARANAMANANATMKTTSAAAVAADEVSGAHLCRAVGVPFVRFAAAFPASLLYSRRLRAPSGAPPRLGFDRAVGTALVLAHLEVRNVLPKREMIDRIHAASQLDFALPVVRGRGGHTVDEYS